MYQIFIICLATIFTTTFILLLIIVKNLNNKVRELFREKEIFLCSDREFKMQAQNTSAKFFGSLNELHEAVRLRNNLVLDNLEELKRRVIKKEDFDVLFELLKREKVLIENATDEAIKKAEKKKWDMWSSALGCKEKEE